MGVYYHGEHPAKMFEEVTMAFRESKARSAQDILEQLPVGGARNALDCAIWDLRAKKAGKPVWMMAGVNEPRPLLTTYTIGADSPAKMANLARHYGGAAALKLKLLGDDADAERVLSVRNARPDVWLAVDSNQGFTPDSFDRLLPALLDAQVQLVEQPFPVGQEKWLDGLDSPIDIAADESVQSVEDLHLVEGRCDLVNIKLDKCGGLTAALEIAQLAQRMNLRLMVGNMGGTSLAMAAGFVVGQLCDVVDLDGPIFLVKGRGPGGAFRKRYFLFPRRVWGPPRRGKI